MNRSQRLSAFVSASLVAAATLLGAPRSAKACSIPCEARPLAVAGKVLPANVRALSLDYALSENPASSPQLTLNGLPVAASVQERAGGAKLLVPDAPLQAGSYALTYDNACDRKERTAAFDVGPAVAVPVKTGTIRIATRFVFAYQGMHYATSCEPYGPPDVDHMIADVTFEPASELGAHLPIMEFTQSITGPDGQTWPFLARESFSLAGNEAGGFKSAEIMAVCAGDARGAGARGTYTVTIAGHVLGADGTLPATTASVDLQCPPGAGGAAAPPPGSSPEAGGPGADADSHNGSATGGCSVSAMSSPSKRNGAFGAIVVGVVALSLAIRRRRLRTAR